MSEKLQKILARSGQGSRRKIEAMIRQGLISVDGKPATLGDRVDVAQCPKICLNGQPVLVKSSQDIPCRVLAYYKPEGEFCTRQDTRGRPTVFEQLPELSGSRWVAVGRLDVNTSGLLLFTNDGELARRLMHPSYKIEREYAVRVYGQVDNVKIKQLEQGIQLEDGPAAFLSIQRQGGEGVNQWYKVTLAEGRNREVRRLWEATGVQVSRLIRVRYGDIALERNIARGKWVELSLKEVNRLRERVGLATVIADKPVAGSKRFNANGSHKVVKRYSQDCGNRENLRSGREKRRSPSAAKHRHW